MPAALVASTARIAMISSAGLTSGVVPASIASLSDGVLKSMLFARLKLISATALLFGAAATGGVILAQQGEQPPKARAEPSAAVWTIKGTVIDELGRAVAGATIQRQPSESPSSEDKTAADGTFTLNVGGERSFTRGVAAITEAEAKIGLVRFGEVPDLEAIGAMTITVKPSQAVRVRVRDAGGNPVPGAAVESIDFSYRSRAETDPDGVAILHLPANGRVQWVIGLKSGVGFDYFENYQSKPATDFPPLPGELKLTLDGAWAFRLKALDSRGQPVPGVVFSPWMLKKNGKIDSANVGGSIAVRATADHAGTATFDWLPKELGSVNFVARPGTYTSPEPPLLIRSATTEATIRLDRNTRLSGTVRYPDGRPAPHVLVRVQGQRPRAGTSFVAARTGPDGSYNVDVPPGGVYMIGIDDETWAAPSLLSPIVVEAQSQAGMDITLTRGSLLHGQLTEGADHHPSSGAPTFANGGRRPDSEGTPRGAEVQECNWPVERRPVPTGATSSDLRRAVTD